MNKIAVLIPCYNEEITIKKVIDDFKNELPEATIIVCDNNSSDNTFSIAKSAGAVTKKEFEQGKGNAVRSMIRDHDADIYIMVDGDDTYPAKQVHELLKPVLNKEAHMTVGDRHSNGSYQNENKRVMHNFGNMLVKNLINRLYKKDLADIMSGYRVLSKEFATFLPILSDGFELETEMTIFALDRRFKIKEVPIEYKDRPANSFSKLNTYLDGAKVIKSIFTLFKDYKPLQFFSSVFLVLLVISITVGLPVISEFLQTGLVAKIPSAVLASAIMIIAILSLFVGFILDTIVRQHKEIHEHSRNTYNKENR